MITKIVSPSLNSISMDALGHVHGGINQDDIDEVEALCPKTAKAFKDSGQDPAKVTKATWSGLADQCVAEIGPDTPEGKRARARFNAELAKLK